MVKEKLNMLKRTYELIDANELKCFVKLCAMIHFMKIKTSSQITASW